HVTGVQTCALPICHSAAHSALIAGASAAPARTMSASRPPVDPQVGTGESVTSKSAPPEPIDSTPDRPVRAGPGRVVRAADGPGLENQWAAMSRGFESHTLRIT